MTWGFFFLNTNQWRGCNPSHWVLYSIDNRAVVQGPLSKRPSSTLLNSKELLCSEWFVCTDLPERVGRHGCILKNVHIQTQNILTDHLCTPASIFKKETDFHVVRQAQTQHSQATCAPSHLNQTGNPVRSHRPPSRASSFRSCQDLSVARLRG